MQNCGLRALEGITELENISMFTLIHLARDNGINLYLCQVEKKDLLLVPRPAIFHSEDHFTLVEDGKALPQEDFSGWVLTTKPIGSPYSYSIAKRITGRKKGGDILGPVVTGIASIINPFLGAAVGAGFAAHKVTGGAGVTPAKGEFWRIPVGGALGYLGGQPAGGSTFGVGNATLAGGLGAAQEIPGAVKTGNYGAVLAGGLGAYGGQKFTSGAVSGLANAPAGAGPIGQAGAAVKGGVNNLLGKAVNPASTSASALPQGGAGGSYGLSPQSGGSYGLAQGSPAMSLASGGVNQAGADLLAKSSASQAVSTNTGGNIFGSLNQGDLIKGGLALAAGQIGKPPEYAPDSVANYEAARKYVGENSAFPKATMDQLNNYVTSSIADLKKQFFNPDAGNAALLNLDKQYQEALKGVERQAAQSGQSIQTSSDAQRQYQEIQRQWTEARTNTIAQLDQQATQQAVEAKQWAVQQSIQAGQIDMESALELARFIGRDEELKAAVAQDNYDSFQAVIRDILSIGQESGQPSGNSPASNLTSTLGRG